MNPAGKCVLLLTNQGKSVAKIIDKLGQTSKTYEKKIHDEDNSKSMDQNEKQKVEANRSNDINLGQNNLKIEKLELSSSITNEKKVFERNVPHVWNFDGLKMEFYPESWEVNFVFVV